MNDTIGKMGVVCVAVATLFWASSFFTSYVPSISNGDEGLIAQHASRVLAGEVPFRDFYTMLPPVASCWFAAFLSLAGTPFFGLRCGVLVVAIVNLIAVILILRRLAIGALPVWLAVVVPCVYLFGPTWFIASGHWLALMWCLIGFYCLLSAGDEEGAAARWRFFLSGGCAALAALTIQHRGGLWLLAVPVCLFALPRERRLAALRDFASGVLTTVVPFFAALWLMVGWELLFQSLILDPLTLYPKVHDNNTLLTGSIAKLWTSMVASWRFHDAFVDWLRIAAYAAGFVAKMLMMLLPLAGVLALFDLGRAAAARTYQYRCVAAFFVASYLATLHRLSDTTLTFAAPAGLLVLALWYRHKAELGACAGRWGRVGGRIALAWCGFFGCVVVAFWGYALVAPRVAVEMPAGRVSAYLAGEVETLRGVSQFMQANKRPEDGLFCYSYLAMFYFLLQEKNPTPHDLVTYPMTPQIELDRIEAILDRTRCRWVLWDHRPFDYDSIGRYLQRNYRVRAQFRYVSILERIPGGPAEGRGEG